MAPPRPGDRLFADYPYDVPVGHGFGEDRHILASCTCGRQVVLTERWCRNRRLGGRRTKDLAARLSCARCGQVGVTIAVVAGPASLLPASGFEILD